jgi:hypothetical protein
MDEAATANYADVLAKALLERKGWLEKTEIPRLKDELRLFHVSFSALHSVFLKKKLVSEDPYRNESKITELEIPETGPFNEARRRDQISVRLAAFDSQLDFLVNFYQFGVDYLNLSRIRKIAELIRYIDWAHLTTDSKFPNTKAVAEIAINSKQGDKITLSVISESLGRLSKCTVSVMGILRQLSIYHRENYKLAVRGAIKGMPASEANTANVKKRISQAAPGAPHYQEFIEDVIREDYTDEGEAAREEVLKSLKLAPVKETVKKQEVDYKLILLDGIRAIGGCAVILTEITQKIDDNQLALAKERKSIWHKVQQLIRSITHSGEEEVIYEITITDPAKGTQKIEKLNLGQFRAELDRKIKVFTAMSGTGTILTKLKGMPEDQVLGYLERAIRDLQGYHKTAAALDDYFKNTAQESRDRIRGIKPELSSVKNCIVKANQMLHEYSATKEEAEQLKRLGINKV